MKLKEKIIQPQLDLRGPDPVSQYYLVPPNPIKGRAYLCLKIPLNISLPSLVDSISIPLSV